MENFWKKMTQGFSLIAILYVLLGLVLFIWPAISSTILCYAFGVLVLIYGLTHLYSYYSQRRRQETQGLLYQLNLVVGIVAAGLGLFMLISPTVVLSILPIVLGLTLLVQSVSKVQQSFELKATGDPQWWASLALALLVVALGILLLMNPFGAATTLVRFIGACLLLEGGSDLWTLWRIRHFHKQMEGTLRPMDVKEWKDL